MHWIDPDFLTPHTSTVTRYLFNPKGDADGMLLADGTEAHFPPHLSQEVLRHIRPGEAVTLYGVKPRSADMIACVALQSAGGKRISDTGPPPKKKKSHADKRVEDDRESIELEGIVERTLHGPKGEVRGVLLTAGTLVRFPPHVVEGSLKALLTPGKPLAVRGEARSVSGTQVIEAKALGKSKAHLKAFDRKPHD